MGGCNAWCLDVFNDSREGEYVMRGPIAKWGMYLSRCQSLMNGHVISAFASAHCIISWGKIEDVESRMYVLYLTRPIHSD